MFFMLSQCLSVLCKTLWTVLLLKATCGDFLVTWFQRNGVTSGNQWNRKWKKGVFVCFNTPLVFQWNHVTTEHPPMLLISKLLSALSASSESCRNTTGKSTLKQAMKYFQMSRWGVNAQGKTYLIELITSWFIHILWDNNTEMKWTDIKFDLFKFVFFGLFSLNFHSKSNNTEKPERLNIFLIFNVLKNQICVFYLDH